MKKLEEKPKTGTPVPFEPKTTRARCALAMSKSRTCFAWGCINAFQGNLIPGNFLNLAPLKIANMY